MKQGVLGRTLEALRRVGEAEVGCDFWLGPEFGLKIGWLDRLGLNPSLEAIALQLAVIVGALVTFVALDRRGRHAAAAEARKHN